MCPENPFYVVAQQLRVTLHQTSSDDEPGDDVLVFDNSGGICKALTKSEYDECLARLKWVREHYSCIGHSNLEEAYAKTIVDCEKAEQNGEVLFGSFTDAQKRFMNWSLDRIAIDLNFPASGIAASYYGDGESDGLHGECLPLIDGGYYRLLQHMASKYPLDIRFQHVLTKVDWSQSLVQLEFDNGVTYECEKCLLTVRSPVNLKST